MNPVSSLHRLLVAALAGLALAAPALAEDIDIYSGAAASGDLPNVLLVLDSSANWSSSLPVPDCFYKDGGVLTASGPKASNPGKEQGTKMAIEKCALYNVIDALPVKGSPATPDADALFNVGLMIFNESPAANSGGYPRKAIIPLTSNNKAAFKTIIRNLSIGDDKGNNAAFAKTMYEALLYFKGSAPYRGTATTTKYDPTAFGDGHYMSPSSSSCGRNYVIFIGNGGPGEVTNNEAQALLNAAIDADAAANPSKYASPQPSAASYKAQITYPTSQVTNADQGNWADEFARFMRQVDVSGKEDVQGIITHAVAVTGSASDGLYPNFMRSMANYGGGSYFAASSVDTLVTSLLDIFNQIQAVNSVFASASLPVSVNLQGTYKNQVFMGMFRPDKDGKPRWVGNLKQYKFGLDDLDALFLSDATGAAAVSSSTGFLNPSAVSYWTTASTFWSGQPSGVGGVSDSPDGEVVEKGGVGQRLRTIYANSQTDRKIYTCIGCAAGTDLSSSAAAQFVQDNAAIGLSNELINWVRGTDNVAGDERGPTPATSPPTTVRPSVHGDVLHSRPAVIDYGGSTGVIVFYGGNDGMLHAVKGNQSSTDGGDELWGFVPQEMFGTLNRLRANTPEIRLSTTPAAAAATPRDYFVDGPIGVYRKVAGGVTTRVIIYVGMRRGGRLLYALDVTNPAAPRFLWKKSNGSANMALLGQTWSAPKTARIKGRTDPILIMGGGYDATAEDASSPGSTTMGNTVFVLDAISGDFLRAFTTLSGGSGSVSSSVAADVTLADIDFDGLVDRAYAVDTGGIVYRMDFEKADGTAANELEWTISKFADLSGGTDTGRKFFFPPDLVSTTEFVALSFGSGDREKPLLSATQDHFFQVFDRRSKGLVGDDDEITPVVWGDLTAASDVSNFSGSGCYVALAQGEKVVNAAASIAGNVFFGTNKPSAGSSSICSANLGLAKSYAMPLFCVEPTGNVLVGGGLPPGPVVGLVEIGGKFKSFVIGGPNAKGSAIEVMKPPGLKSIDRKRRYWSN